MGRVIKDRECRRRVCWYCQMRSGLAKGAFFPLSREDGKTIVSSEIMVMRTKSSTGVNQPFGPFLIRPIIQQRNNPFHLGRL